MLLLWLCALFAAAALLASGAVDLVIVGADRIAANGDTANKIGTYTLAVLAKAHGVPFYIAAPVSTIDITCPSGQAIPIEERSASEVVEAFGRRIAPVGITVRHPAFDVTPAHLITAIITDRVNVGGSESGQQSGYQAKGASGADAIE